MKYITTFLFVLTASLWLGACQQPHEVTPRLSNSHASARTSDATLMMRPTSQDTPAIVYRDSPDLTEEEKLFFSKHPEATTLHRYPYGTRIYFSPVRDTPMPKDLSVLFRTGVICPQNKPAAVKGSGGGILPPGCMTFDEYAQQIEAYFEQAGYGDVVVNIYHSEETNMLTIEVYNAQIGQTPGGLIATIITALFK